MNKIIFVLIGGVALLGIGCTKLNVSPQSQYTPANFPTTAADYTAAIGPIYTQLANSSSANTRYAVEYWRMQELSTDEAIIPARNGNYDDGGQYRFLHMHTWSPDHPNVIGCWQWGFGGIDKCNSLINVFNEAPNSPNKAGAIAEVKAMRDLFCFFMMDLYGNIPIIDTFPVVGSPKTQSRAQVFAFIESDLKSLLPLLSTEVDASTYGRATKFMAFALLEKMYLNAEYYTGTARYSDVVAMADSIQLQGPYALDASYGSIFAPTNGPGVRETIFAVPYDANLIPGNQMTRYGFASYIYPLYNLPAAGSIAMSTDSGFYHQNFVLAGDIRDTFWLRGPQQYFPNQTIAVSLYPSSILPVIRQLYPLAVYPASNTALYADYTSGTLPGVVYYLPAPYNIAFWNINYTDSLVLRGDPAKMDLGDDIFAQCEGIRSKKFYPDPNENAQSQDQNNDIPVFRLADVLLMKAEAILRGASATTIKGTLQTPVVLVNQIRTRVSAQPATSSFGLDSVLPERAREFAWEGWRRNDLIRFGRFEGAWGFNPGNPNTDLRIYPVPSDELSLNPNLAQNPGY